MNNKLKNLIVGGLAIFGLVTIISSATSNPTIVHEGSNTPESHVWEFHLNDPASGTGSNGMNAMAFAINKVTGEVRKYETRYNNISPKSGGGAFGHWRIAGKVE